MFDSAQVRGVLRCYDAIDRVMRGLPLSLRCLLSEWRQNDVKKKDSLSVPLFFFLISFEFTYRLREKKRAELNQTALSVDEILLRASGRPRGGGRHQLPGFFFFRTLPQTTSQRPSEVRSWHMFTAFVRVISTFRPISHHRLAWEQAQGIHCCTSRREVLREGLWPRCGVDQGNHRGSTTTRGQC